MNIRQLLSCARGDEPCDTVFKNSRILNVFTGELVTGNIGVKNGTIIGIGDYNAPAELDMKRRIVAPGFVDAHVHIESSMIGVSEFSRTVLAAGTTAVVSDPHEIANVMGKGGVDFMLKSAENQPLDIYFTLSSCVPATHMESSGGVITAQDIFSLLEDERVVGLAEMMNFPGVVHGDEAVLEKIRVARKFGKVMDGHSPGLSGKELNAYVGAGIGSDHECVTPAEAREKLSVGMAVMVREGTGAKNLKDLLPVITPKTAHQMMWCTDDRHPHDLMVKGHIDDVIRKAISMGLDAVTAIQMATINPARYFRIPDIGAIAPGRKANLVILSDLACPVVTEVYTKGVKVAEEGRILPEIKSPENLPAPFTMNVDTDHLNFQIPARTTRVHLIEMVKNQITTQLNVTRIPIVDNMAAADISRDILKCAVIERHKRTGNIGKGFVRGFGLRNGAIASSVAHDSHNIIVVGTNDEDMKAAVLKVSEMGGGMRAAAGGKILASLALPIAGLMSNKPISHVCRQLENLNGAARQIGSIMDDPFMALSFMALPVIPEIKITDIGLVDVAEFKIIPLFAD